MSGKNNTANIDAQKAKQFDSFIKEAQKANPGSVFVLGDNSTMDVEVIPTGAVSLDVALGVGGLPLGRIVELYGPEGSGKTSLALSVAAQAQVMGGAVGYIDVENAIDMGHVQDMGVDPEYFALAQPMAGDEALQMVETMALSGAFSLIVVDSVAALVSRQEMDADIGDVTVAATARLMSQGMRKLVSVINKSNVVVIFINQLREKVGQMYGNPEVTPGGRALKYAASVRLDIRSSASSQLKEKSGRVYGQTCTVSVKKNKVAPPQRKATYDLIFGEGISAESSILEVAVELGVVERKGASYFDLTTGERIGVGKDNVKAILVDQPELSKRLTESIYASLQSSNSSDPFESTVSSDGKSDVSGKTSKD